MPPGERVGQERLPPPPGRPRVRTEEELPAWHVF